MSKPKVLVFDVETAPIIASVWGLWDNNVGLSMIKSDWHLLSYAAKWLDAPVSQVFYADNRHSEDMEDDKNLLRGIWKLLDEADIVITQNGNSFDIKKLNARFIINGMKPPSSYKKIDTKLLAKKYFAFTSNKLEYMTDKLNTKYKKLKHSKYQGFELWKQCLAGNMSAWAEMEKYNKYDVLSLEELYKKLIPWDNSVNYNLYNSSNDTACTCGNLKFRNKGFTYTAHGKFSRFKCTKCGAEVRGRVNLFTEEKRASLKRGITG